jgi:hypothetical protein
LSQSKLALASDNKAGTGKAGSGKDSAQPVLAKQTYHIFRFSKPPAINGVLDDTWKQAEIPTEFYEVSPQRNKPSEVKTVGYLGYDDKNLYFALHCYDPHPKSVRASLTGRDKIIFDDYAGVYLDTFGDGRHAYEFMVNPRGVQLDAFRTEGQGEDFLWDGTWASAGHTTGDGWIVQGKVPLKNMRFSKKSVQDWKFIFVRVYPRSRGRMQIANIQMDYTNPCLICQFQNADGVEKIEPGRNLEIDPTFTSHYTDRPLQLNGHTNIGADAGVDIKWGITQNTQLQLTVNPDFSQVESDVNQLAVNNRFAISFPERRPFFLESNDAFAARGTPAGFFFYGIPPGIAGGNSGQPLNLFYSRSIAEPLIAGKVFQRTDKDQLSVLWAVDELPTIILANPNGSSAFQLPGESVDTIARYNRALFKSSSVGFEMTDMRSGGGHSTVGAADLLLRPYRNLDISAQFAHSDANAMGSPELLAALAGRATTGNSFQVQADTRGKNYNVQAGYTDIGRDFRSDMGFLQQTDLRTVDVSGTWQWIPDKNRIFVRAGPALRFVNSYNHLGFLMERSYYLGVVGIARKLTYFKLHGGFSEQTVSGIQFNGLKRVIGEFQSRPVKWLQPINATIIAGDIVDVVNVRLGKGYALGLGSVFRPTSQLSFTFDLSREALQRQDTGAEVYHAQVGRLNTGYQFTRRMALRSILQYSYVIRDPHQYVAPVLKSNHALNSFLLFSYKLKPQTVFYAGYNDSFVGPKAVQVFDATHPINDPTHPQNAASCTVDASVGPAGFQGSPSGLAGQAATTRCRTVFIKLGYTFAP